MSFGLVLKRWLPFHYAMGIGGFAAWFITGLIYARRSAPKYGIPVLLAALITGIASGLCVGLLSYYFPW
jgi:branched-subunit amino acid transport protein